MGKNFPQKQYNKNEIFRLGMGKQMDTFDASFQRMMKYHGQEAVTHVDCIGKRCFGFLMGDCVKEWFRPAVSLEYVADQIEKKTGISITAIDTKRKTEDILELLKEGVVVGPVWSVEAVPEIRHLYYHGDTHYLFISGNGEGKYRITDPEGFPEFWTDEKEIAEMLQKDQPSILYLKEKKFKSNKPVDFKEVLEEGLSFHSCLHKEKKYVLDAVRNYHISSQNRLSLQYGLINYIQQTDKVFRLSDHCGILSSNALDTYQILKNRVYHIYMEQNILELPEVLDSIWALLT